MLIFSVSISGITSIMRIWETDLQIGSDHYVNEIFKILSYKFAQSGDKNENSTTH